MRRVCMRGNAVINSWPQSGIMNTFSLWLTHLFVSMSSSPHPFPSVSVWLSLCLSLCASIIPSLYIKPMELVDTYTSLYWHNSLHPPESTPVSYHGNRVPYHSALSTRCMCFCVFCATQYFCLTELVRWSNPPRLGKHLIVGYLKIRFNLFCLLF